MVKFRQKPLNPTCTVTRKWEKEFPCQQHVSRSHISEKDTSKVSSGSLATALVGVKAAIVQGKHLNVIA